MTAISDEELQAIVEKVVQRTLHGQTPRVEDASEKIDQPTSNPLGQRSIALGADHGGYNMKEMLAAHLVRTGYQIIDCGTNSTESVDYPDFAFAVAEKVSLGYAWRGIIVDGAGIGSCMTANKVPGVQRHRRI